jgi:hypothetical protein
MVYPGLHGKDPAMTATPRMPVRRKHDGAPFRVPAAMGASQNIVIDT